MKILVIGGTEFFGEILVEKLLKEGHDLTLLTRGNRKPTSFWSKISHIKCDRSQYSDFKLKLAEYDFDVVIDNVVSGQADIESIIDVFGSKPIQYILCSSVAVYQNWNKATELLKESAALLEPSLGDDWKIAYANGKRAAEKYLIEYHDKLRYTIMRPTVIEGQRDPHKRTWFWIQRIQDKKPIIISTKDLHTLYRHVSSEDVANAFLLAVGNERAYDQIYNVAGEDILSVKDYIRYIAKALGKEEIKLCWIPESKLNLELPKYALPPFFEDVRLVSCIDKIKKELGFQPQDSEIWLGKTVEAFREEKEASFGYENRNEENNVSLLFKKNQEILIPHVNEKQSFEYDLRN